ISPTQACELDVIGLAQQDNTVTITAYAPAGDQLGAPLQLDASYGKAVRTDLNDLFGDNRQNIGMVVASSPAASAAYLSCVNTTASGATSGFTFPSLQYSTLGSTFLPVPPKLSSDSKVTATSTLSTTYNSTESINRIFFST